MAYVTNKQAKALTYLGESIIENFPDLEDGKYLYAIVLTKQGENIICNEMSMRRILDD